MQPFTDILVRDGNEIDWCPQDYKPLFKKDWKQSKACDCTGVSTGDEKDNIFTIGATCTSQD